jgi:multicomponent Na+:H+ antiporter subunit C
VSVLLAFCAAFLFATGTWMLLQRRLSRILIGVGLVGHGSNILLLVSGGGGGNAPIIETAEPSEFTDPLPQALVLTSIVITFGVTAFLLALGYRSWRITHDDVVEDDVEDRFIARRRDEDQAVADEQLAERDQAAEEDRV